MNILKNPRRRKSAVFATLASILLATAAGQACAQNTGAQDVVLASDVEWGPLNPARGDASPRAGALWGDRTAKGASGFLVQFTEGFASPPHIHNVSYRGVVISGLIHNDDPDAENMWLPAGSYWTQPAGDAHITSADAARNMAYIEISDGPYLVRPTDDAFDNGEASINVDESNLVWLNAANINWIQQSGAAAKVAFLWNEPQDGQASGSLIKLPEGYAGTISTDSTFRAVVIQGSAGLNPLNDADALVLDPGSYFGSQDAAKHFVSCAVGADCIIYVRSRGAYSVEAGRTD